MIILALFLASGASPGAEERSQAQKPPGALSCVDLVNAGPEVLPKLVAEVTDDVSAREFLDRFQRAVEAFERNVGIPSELDKKQRDHFEKGSYRILLRLDHGPQTHVSSILWDSMEARIFPSPVLEQSENIREFQQLFDRWYAALERYGSLNKLLKAVKKPKTKLKSLTYLHTITSALSVFITDLFGVSWDLTTAEGLYQLMGLSEKEEQTPENLMQRRTLVLQKNRELNARIREELEVNSGYQVLARLTRHFFKQDRVRLKQKERAFFIRHGGKDEILELIGMLPLTEEQLLELYEKMDLLQTIENITHRHLGQILLFYYSVQLAGDAGIGAIIEEHPDMLKTESGFLMILLRLKAWARHKIYMEELEDQAMEMAEVLAMRLEMLESRIILSTFFEDGGDWEAPFSQQTKPILEQIQSIDVSDWFDRFHDLDNLITQIEVAADVIIEQFAGQQALEDIHGFYELNYSWERLLADKAYDMAVSTDFVAPIDMGLVGADFDDITFSQSVIDEFKKDPSTGRRFLISLHKGYVGKKGSSGLRKGFTDLHPLFRDIKVLKHGGKIRIGGKLVGRTIHFFHIHKGDFGYRKKVIHPLVERFKPPVKP